MKIFLFYHLSAIYGARLTNFQIANEHKLSETDACLAERTKQSSEGHGPFLHQSSQEARLFALVPHGGKTQSGTELGLTPAAPL
mmetsp:Transcript_105052/g.197884  ORF Transcript_105052/g.197884 Transcript_105052/m.197884 type:complete len:84 (-) Transcript_105052:1077-1328(-)